MQESRFRDWLIINDKKYTAGELMNIDKSVLPEWEKANYEFISQWLDGKPWIEVQTSGSTGAPKTIKIQKSTMIQSALNTAAFFGLKQGDAALMCLPASYIAGKMMIVRTFVLGLNLHWQKPSASPVVSRNFKFAAMTPMQVQNIINTDKKQLEKIENLILGGAPVNDFIKKNLRNLNTKAYETYGMTETASHIAIKPLNPAAGKEEYFTVLEGIEIGVDERSCLKVINSNLGIKNIVTNDIINLVDKNKFLWLGRFDNIINSGGIKLIPEQIEAKIKPFINSSFIVFGIKDEKYNEIPALIVEGDMPLDLERLKKVLDKFEFPKRIFRYDKFPRSSTGKIQRKALIKNITEEYRLDG